LKPIEETKKESIIKGLIKCVLKIGNI